VHGLAHQAAAGPIDRVHEDAVSDHPARDAGAELVDLARDVEAHDHRHRDADPRHAPSREDVVIVERRGADAHDHLARSRHGVGEVLLEDQPLGAAVLVDDRRSHRESPFSVAGRSAGEGLRALDQEPAVDLARAGERQLGEQLHVARVRIGRAVRERELLHHPGRDRRAGRRHDEGHRLLTAHRRPPPAPPRPAGSRGWRSSMRSTSPG
jgi:hypothetical protein